MEVAFGLRAQYTAIAVVSVLMLTQVIGAVIFAGKAQAAGSPTVTTGDVWSVGQTTATLQLRSSDASGRPDASYSIEYGTSISYGSSTPTTGLLWSSNHNTTLHSLEDTSVSTSGWSGRLRNPEYGGVRDSAGNFYIPAWEDDDSACRVMKFNAAGNFVYQLGGTCTVNSPTELNRVKGALAVDADDNLYVGQSDSQYVLKYAPNGDLLGNIDMGGDGAKSITVDDSNNLYILTENTHQIVKYDSSGINVSGWASTELGGQDWGNGYYSLATNSLGDVYVRCACARIWRYDSDGQALGDWLVGPGGSNTSMLIGPDDTIYVYGSGILPGGFSQEEIIFSYDKEGNELDRSNFNIGLLALMNGFTRIDNTTGALEILSRSATPTFFAFSRKGASSLSGLTCGTTYHYRAKVVTDDGTNYGSDRTFTTTACPASVHITTETLPDGMRDEAYSATIDTESVGSVGTLSYQISDGYLPGGLTLNEETGEISGTPDASSTYTATFTVSVYGEYPVADSKELSIHVVGFEPISINDYIGTLNVGQPFEHIIEAEYGFGTPVYTLVSGSLPTGLGLDSAGTISGTPTDDGVYSFTIRATDLSGSADNEYRVVVYNLDNQPASSPFISITSPTANTTLANDDVLVTGTGPANSTLSLWMDDYQIGTTDTDTAGSWSYHVADIFPGTHQFNAKWQASGSIMLVPAAGTFEAPLKTKLSLVDLSTDRVIKTYYTSIDAGVVLETVISASTNKVYNLLVNFGAGSTAIQELDLTTGAERIIANNLMFSGNVLLPPAIAVSDDGQMVYAVGDSEIVSYNVSQQLVSRRTLPAPLAVFRTYFSRITVSADKAHLYLGYALHDGNAGLHYYHSIGILDLQTLAVTTLTNADLGTANLKETFTNIEHAGNQVYATYGDGIIVILNSDTNQVIKTVDMGLVVSDDSDEDEHVLFSAYDAERGIMYTSVKGATDQSIEIRAVNLQTEVVTVLNHLDSGSEQLVSLAYDPITNGLLVHGQDEGNASTSVNRFNLQTNSFYSGPGYPIVSNSPASIGFAFGSKLVYQQSQGFRASTNFTLPLPEIVDTPECPEDFACPQNPEEPTITDVTPASVIPAPPKNTPIKAPQTVIAAQNNLLALAKRIPEPFAIGFPWFLLALALILVGIQYYQVHTESVGTKRMQKSVANQERLVEEQNNFVALSTHYLHTPLTVMEGEISLMVKAGTITQAQASKLKATLTSLNAEAEAALAEEEQGKVE